MEEKCVAKLCKFSIIALATKLEKLKMTDSLQKVSVIFDGQVKYKA